MPNSLVNKEAFLFAVILVLIGAVASMSQILLAREIMYISQGNELTFGFFLFLYIAITALGSFLVTKKGNHKSLLALLATASISLPIIVVGFYLSRIFLASSPTELIPIAKLTWFTLALIMPFCLSIGASFPLLLKSVNKLSINDKIITKALVIEALGSGVGALISFYIFSPFWSPIKTALLISLLIILIILLLNPLIGGGRFLFIFCITIIIMIFPLFLSNSVHTFLKTQQWQQFEYIDGQNSRYGYIDVIRNSSQISIYENGVLLGTSALADTGIDILKIIKLQKMEINKILLLGGGYTGLLANIKKSDIQDCLYVEQNTVATKLVNKYLYNITNGTSSNISSFPMDDIHFLKQSFLKENFDAVIMSKPEPKTLANNRFYTSEYFQLISSVLSPKGIFAFTITSSAEHCTQGHLFLLTSLYKSLSAVFPFVAILPGNKCIFISSNDPQFEFNDGNSKEKSTRVYLNLLLRKNAPIKREELEKGIQRELSSTKENRNFNPQGYMYYMLQGTNYLITPFHSAIKATQKTPYGVIIVVLASIGLFLIIKNKRKLSLFSVIVAILGLVNMSMQLIIMLAFQIAHGYLFSYIGILTASFMFGSALGGILLLTRGFPSIESSRATLRILLFSMFLFIFMFFLIIAYHNLPEYIFSIGSLGIGVFYGSLFPIIASITKKMSAMKEFSLAKIYGWDLIGTSIGAALTPLLVGILGIYVLMYILLFFIFLCLYALD